MRVSRRFRPGKIFAAVINQFVDNNFDPSLELTFRNLLSELLPFAIGGVIDVIRDLISLDEIARVMERFGKFHRVCSLGVQRGQKSELEHRCTETFTY